MTLSKFLLAAAALFTPTAPVAAQATTVDSLWRNPQNSVHVRIHDCGTTRCGTVIWANEKAITDSARGGTPNLIGTELFRDFREVGPNVWNGKVFVPDLNHTFSGTGTVVDANTIIARGCAVGNVGCKSQTWTRVTSSAR